MCPGPLGFGRSSPDQPFVALCLCVEVSDSELVSSFGLRVQTLASVGVVR
jgi:hypothetical protein